MKNRFLQSILLISFIGVFHPFVQSQVNSDPAKVWAEMIELDHSLVYRHILNDLPGSIVVLRPEGNGKFKPEIIGRKVLKNGTALPEVKTTPTLLIEDVQKKEIAASLSYLSMISASMKDNEHLRFSVTETAFSSIIDNDINWDAFDQRVASYLLNVAKYPPGTLFGVIRVANLIIIEHQRFVEKKKAAEISGWGFSGQAGTLSESSTKNIAFKVGVALTFSDAATDVFENLNSETIKNYTKDMSTENRKAFLTKSMNEYYAKQSSIITQSTE